MDLQQLLPEIQRLQTNIALESRNAVHEDTLAGSGKLLDVVGNDGFGDETFKVDTIAENRIIKHAQYLGEQGAKIIVVCEGVDNLVFPNNISPEEAEWVIIHDPLDGTRMIGYDVGSAWAETAIAPNMLNPKVRARYPNREDGPTNLADIELAVMTEVPNTRAAMMKQYWAFKREEGFRFLDRNLYTGEEITTPKPKMVVGKDLTRTIATFFQPFRGGDGNVKTTQIAEKIWRELYGPIEEGQGHMFVHQEITTAGQLEHLITGQYAFQGDIRPIVFGKEKENPGLCCHPYDVCVKLIAEKAGVIVTNAYGEPLTDPLDTTTNVGWLGFANQEVFDHVFPAYKKVMTEMGYWK